MKEQYNNLSPIQKKVAGVLLLFSGFVLVKKIMAGPTDDEIYQDVPILGPVNESIVISVAAELYSVLDNSLVLSAGARCDAYERLYKLNDEDFKAVANQYKNQYKQTLRNAIADTNLSGCYLYTDYESLVIDKLNFFNIP